MFMDDLSEKFQIATPEERPSGYSTLLAARVPIQMQSQEFIIGCEPQRVCAASIGSGGHDLSVVGVYVPSRGPRDKRNVAKRAFQEAFSAGLKCFVRACVRPIVMAGDLNIVDPDHFPRRRVFREWEYAFYREILGCGLVDAYLLTNSCQNDYSWFGRTGNGYRLDHIFVSNDLASLISSCMYDHHVRDMGLSDHSAMWLTLEML